MDDLVAFLRARLDEDEAAAKAAQSPSPWKAADHEADSRIVTDAEGEAVVYNEGTPTLEEAAHIALHDPARALRRAEAIRTIIGEQTSDHAPIEADYPVESHGFTCRTCVAWQDDEGAHEFGIAIPEKWPCKVARAVTAEFSDHPDYRQEWKP